MIKEASLEVTQGGPMIFRTSEFRVALPESSRVIKRYEVSTFTNITLQGEMQHNLLLESVAVDAIDRLHLNVDGIIYFQHRTPFRIDSLTLDVVEQLQRLLASSRHINPV